MSRFSTEQVHAAFELQQLIVGYCHELDLGGLNATNFFTDDGVVEVGRMTVRGHAAMQAFYAQLAENVREESPGGIRTSRHVCANLRFEIERDTAMVRAVVTNYSGAGAAPLMNATLPTVVSDVRFECQRDAEDRWRICGLYGAPIFVGNDPVRNKTLVESN